MFNIVAKQMAVMGIFMVIGAILFKIKMINAEGSKALTNILIYVITPTAVFKSFCIECTPEKLKTLGISFILCAIVQGMGLLFAHLIYKKKPIEEFAAAYPNAGFFGIPVIQACLGSDAVFFMTPLVLMIGSLQYSYGVSLLTGSKSDFTWKRVLISPNALGFAAGLIVFLTGLGTHIPKLVSNCVDQVCNMSAFFAMTTLGIFFIQSDFKQLYKNIDIYKISLLKLLGIPLVCAIIFKFIPADYAIRYTILLAFAGPIGSNVANYSLLYNKDYSTASLYVAVSTVLCLGTLPLYAAIIEKLLV